MLIVGTLLVRADAGASLGSGHALRCLAVAQTWRRTGGRVVFAMASRDLAIEKRLAADEIELVRIQSIPGSPADATETITVNRRIGADWLILDGYHFGASYRQALRGSGPQLLLLDDNGLEDKAPADIIVNPNLHAREALYPHCQPNTKLLLGVRFALLRNEFLRSQYSKKSIPDVATRILVTLGGSDQNRMALEIVRALREIQTAPVEVIFVLGSHSGRNSELMHAMQMLPMPWQLQSNVVDMSKLMAWADLAISGAGTTCWEMAFMGLPALVIRLADNQDCVAAQLGDAGVAVDLGKSDALRSKHIVQKLEELLLDREYRGRMSQRGPALVDGQGASRVFEYLCAHSVELRPVREDDARILWQWANDPAVRQMSFNSEEISWQNHVTWLREKLNCKNDMFLLGIDGCRVPIGQVRFAIEDTRAAISLSVAPQARGRGFGGLLTRRACRRLFEESSVVEVSAYIKPENSLSCRTFRKAGFQNAGVCRVDGKAAIRLVLLRATQ